MFCLLWKKQRRNYVSVKGYFSAEEIDGLQEIMNIAFGQAAGDLSEVVNIRILLDIPSIRVISFEELLPYLKLEVPLEKVSIVEQHFLGDFSGSALLVFPADVGETLLTLFGANNEIDVLDSYGQLQRETLVEIGNILIGACVGKVVELLKDQVSYSPPRFIIEDQSLEHLQEISTSGEKHVIIMKTSFSFHQHENVHGYLFLVCNDQSIAWLKRAIDIFIDDI